MYKTKKTLINQLSKHLRVEDNLLERAKEPFILVLQQQAERTPHSTKRVIRELAAAHSPRDISYRTAEWLCRYDAEKLSNFVYGFYDYDYAKSEVVYK